jgi:small subunit ribosomal protein S23
MGRYSFAAQNVHKTASLLLAAKQAKAPPPWYDIIGSQPPAKRLVRMPMQRPQKAGKKASKLFTPIKIAYEEDRLRWEYFNDHPWELARPRVVLEDDGKDLQRWNWSLSLDHAISRPEAAKKDTEAKRKQAQQEQTRWAKQANFQALRPISGES